jgi:hypothetical protein
MFTRRLASPVKILLSAIFLLSLSFHAIAQESQSVTVTGMAQVSGDNALSARQAALSDAMRKAVETGLGTMIESRTLVENFALVNDQVYSRAKGFVSSYEVLSEKEEHGTYIIAIKAEVNKSKLGNDLRAIGLLQDVLGKPKMMVMVDEFWWDPGVAMESQSAVDDPASASKIAEIFLTKGFSLVDPQMVKKLRGQELMMMNDLMNNESAVAEIAKKAAQEYGAEVLVLGICKVEPISDAGGKYTASASFSSRVVDASTGALMGTKQFAQSGAGTSPESARVMAASRAGDGAAVVLMDQVLNFWQDKANNGSDYIVKLYNVESFVKQGMGFIKTIKNVSGVNSAKKRSWDESLGRLEVDLTYKGGDVDELTFAILEALMEKPAFENIELREAKGSNINLYLK